MSVITFSAILLFEMTLCLEARVRDGLTISQSASYTIHSVIRSLRKYEYSHRSQFL